MEAQWSPTKICLYNASQLNYKAGKTKDMGRWGTTQRMTGGLIDPGDRG